MRSGLTVWATAPEDVLRTGLPRLLGLWDTAVLGLATADRSDVTLTGLGNLLEQPTIVLAFFAVRVIVPPRTSRRGEALLWGRPGAALRAAGFSVEV